MGRGVGWVFVCLVRWKGFLRVFLVLVFVVSGVRNSSHSGKVALEAKKVGHFGSEASSLALKQSLATVGDAQEMWD